MRIAFVTCETSLQANQLAEQLVQERLAGCVNIIPEIRSIYRWEGKIENASEVLLMIKTEQRKLDELEERILELHSYDTPEFVVLDPSYVNGRYGKWLETVLR